MKKFKSGDIVWTNLGISYGWWPGEYQELQNSAKNKVSVMFFENPKQPKNESEPKDKEEKIGNVRFFDDDKYDLSPIFDLVHVKPYSCDDKTDLICAGLAKFSSDNHKKDSMFDFRARQAQFYKDVEMAEVMTDNDPKVADILAQYEVVDDASDEVKEPPKKKRRRKKRYWVIYFHSDVKEISFNHFGPLCLSNKNE